MPFLKIEKKFSDFCEESPCVHLWVRIAIQNLILRIPKKNSKMFPCRVSFSGVFDEIFTKVP